MTAVSARPDGEDPHAPHGQLPEGGTVRSITRWGADVMHHRNAAVTAYDDELRSLAADMVATMYAADGVGLAACQIGVDRAVFVFDCPDDAGRRTVGVVCNPVVTLPEGKDRKLDESEEGCLSYPGAFVECARPDFATVTGTGLDGEPVEFSGDGLLARCLQHETDHTLGTVFGDRLPTKARKKLTKAHDKSADEYPTGWPAEGP
jgi:peptide deformylase